MLSLSLTPEERARHTALSPTHVAWLDFAASHPEALDPEAFADLQAAELVTEMLQPWPLFLDAASLAPLSQAGVETLRLVKTVPERIFDNDPERMIELYGLDERIVRGAVTLLADPKCLDHVVARGDFVLGPQGFACCEINAAGNIGGWQVGPWKDRMLTLPPIARFLEHSGLHAVPIDPLAILLDHAVEAGLSRGLATSGELNLAVLTASTLPPQIHALVDDRFRAALERRAPGLAGQAVFGTSERQITVNGQGARFGSLPVHLFIDQVMENFDGPIFRAQAAGHAFSFNGLVSPLVSDKRNLALLSEQAGEGSDLYTAEERAAIERFIPWSRILGESFTECHGERIYLPDYVRAHRERLLIKPADGVGGRDVFPGTATEPAEWERRVDEALSGGRWVVQEFVPSETFFFQAREGGAVPHELVWGIFAFGERFASCMLRGAPFDGRAGIINVRRGARCIVLLEVEDGAAAPSRGPIPHEDRSDAL